MAVDIISEINLDMKAPNAEKVYASQYDSTGHIRARLLNDGNKWEVPTGANAIVSYRKSDNIGGYYDTTNFDEIAVAVDSDRSIISIALDPQTMTTYGPVYMQVSFIQYNKRLTTFSFMLQVEKSAIVQSNIESKYFVHLLALSGITVDDTLSILGAAADALTVGNRLNSLQSELGNEIAGETARAITNENLKVNKPIIDPNGTNGQILRSLGNGQTEWTNQGAPTDQQVGTAVENWLDAHPEATTTVQDGSLTYDKFSPELEKTIIEKYDEIRGGNFAAERIWRLISRADANGYDTVGGQSLAYTGSSFIFGGDVSNSEKQRFNEVAMDGTIIRSVLTENSLIGHVNDMAFDRERSLIYVAPVNSGKIVALNYSDFSIAATYDTEISALCGLDYYDGILYVYGGVTGVPNSTYTFGYYNFEENTYTTINTFCLTTRKEANGMVITMQSMAIDGDYAYIITNQTNAIVKINRHTGVIERYIELGEGNGFYPYGEIEGSAFVDGVLYFNSAIYSSQAASKTSCIQLFKTNIGGTVVLMSFVGQTIDRVGPGDMWVNGFTDEAVGLNPIGRGSDPFATVLEACAFIMYNARYTFLKFNLHIRNGASHDYSDDIISLNGINCEISYTANSKVAACNLSNGTYGLDGVKTSSASIECSTANISNSVFDSLYGRISQIYMDASSSATSMNLVSCLFSPAVWSQIDGKTFSRTRLLNFPEYTQELQTNHGNATIKFKRSGNIVTVLIQGTLDETVRYQYVNLTQGTHKYFRNDYPDDAPLRFMYYGQDLNNQVSGAMFILYKGGAVNIYGLTPTYFKSIDIMFSYVVPDYVP